MTKDRSAENSAADWLREHNDRSPKAAADWHTDGCMISAYKAGVASRQGEVDEAFGNGLVEGYKARAGEVQVLDAVARAAREFYDAVGADLHARGHSEASALGHALSLIAEDGE